MNLVFSKTFDIGTRFRGCPCRCQSCAPGLFSSRRGCPQRPGSASVYFIEKCLGKIKFNTIITSFGFANFITVFAKWRPLQKLNFYITRVFKPLNYSLLIAIFNNFDTVSYLRYQYIFYPNPCPKKTMKWTYKLALAKWYPIPIGYKT